MTTQEKTINIYENKELLFSCYHIIRSIFEEVNNTNDISFLDNSVKVLKETNNLVINLKSNEFKKLSKYQKQDYKLNDNSFNIKVKDTIYNVKYCLFESY